MLSTTNCPTRVRHRSSVEDRVSDVNGAGESPEVVSPLAATYDRVNPRASGYATDVVGPDRHYRCTTPFSGSRMAPAWAPGLLRLSTTITLIGASVQMLALLRGHR